MNSETPKEELIRKNKKLIVSNFIVIILLGLVMLMLLNLTITVKEESFLCLNDPLGYGAGKLSEANDADFSCTCGLNKPNSPIIYFDQEGKDIIYPEVDQSSKGYHLDFNFSDLID